MTRYSNNAAANRIADCIEGAEGARLIRTNANVTIDTMSLTAEMSEATGHDYYVTTTNLGNGTLTIGFDAVAGLDLEDVIKVENKTQGWVYNTKGATVTTTSIALVGANQTTGYPACGATDEFEIVYRGTSRLTDKTQMTQISDGTDELDIATDGSAAKTKGVQVLGTDGTNAQILKTRTDGSLLTIADIMLATGNNLIGSSDGTNSDFSVARASDTTLTLGNYPDGSTPKATDIVFIRVQNTSGAHVETLDAKDLTLAISGSTLTVTGFTSSFASSDTFIIGTNVRVRDALDTGLDVNKIIEQSPLYERYTDPVAIISSAQELDTTATDLGSEIDMRGYNQLGVWLTVDIGTSTDVSLRVLHKHTSGGTEEYREIYLGTPGSNITTINLNDYQVASDADQLFKINIPVSATTPFIQLQVYDAADGDGQIDAAYITKAWSN